MYSINGVPLHDPARGRVLRAPTKPLSELQIDRTDVPLAGRHGSVKGIPGHLRPVVLQFVVQTPRSNVEALYALWCQQTLTLTTTYAPGRVAELELVQLSPVGYGAAEEIVDVTATVRMPEPVWRDAVPTVYGPFPFPAGQASIVLSNLWPGMSAPVQDAQIMFDGAIQEPVVTDPSGATFSYATIILGDQWLRLDTANRRAFILNEAEFPDGSWTGASYEKSGWVNYGGPRQAFEITPQFTDPTVRAGRLTITRRGVLDPLGDAPSVRVRGRGAYLIT